MLCTAYWFPCIITILSPLLKESDISSSYFRLSKTKQLFVLDSIFIQSKGPVGPDRFEDLINTQNVLTYKPYQYYHIDTNGLQFKVQSLWAHTCAENSCLRGDYGQDQWSALSLKMLLAHRGWTWEVEKLSCRKQYLFKTHKYRQ